MQSIFAAVMLAAFLAASVSAQSTPQIGSVNFSMVKGAVLGTSYPNATNIIGPVIIRYANGTYRMYFQARDSENYANIMSAVSTDGLHWTYDPGIRIMHGPSSSSVDWEAGEPDVVQASNGTYVMLYTGRQQIPGAPQGAFFHRIVFASSADSVHWTKDGYNFSDQSQMGGFSSSADTFVVNGQYEMYYTGCCANISGIFRAESTNLVRWQTMGQVFRVGHDGSTIRYNGTYYMFFMAPPSFTPITQMPQDVLFMAVSSDGVSWSNEVYRVELANSSTGQQMDTSQFGDPAAMVAPNGTLMVYLNGPMGADLFGIRLSSALPVPPPPTTTSSTTATTSVSSSTATTSAPQSTASVTPATTSGGSQASANSTQQGGTGGTAAPPLPIIPIVIAVAVIAAAAAYLKLRRR